jgi:peptide/nickel transport system permease protein
MPTQPRSQEDPNSTVSGRPHIAVASLLIARALRDKAVTIGSAILLLITVMALFPWAITSRDPNSIDSTARLSGPSRQHLLGTDELGRDVWSRVVYGASISLTVAFIGVSIALILGLSIGIAATLQGTRIDNVVMRITDVLFAFPSILLALVIMAGLGTGARSVTIALAIVYVPRFARVARGAVMVVKNELYVEAARAVGVPEWRIMTRHVLPNILAPLIVQFSVSMGFAIIVEASLSFLGLGLPPPDPAWGSMLARGKNFMEISPWAMLGPGLALTITVVGFNLLGDGLRDLFDPYLQHQNM